MFCESEAPEGWYAGQGGFYPVWTNAAWEQPDSAPRRAAQHQVARFFNR